MTDDELLKLARECYIECAPHEHPAFEDWQAAVRSGEYDNYNGVRISLAMGRAMRERAEKLAEALDRCLSYTETLDSLVGHRKGRSGPILIRDIDAARAALDEWRK